MASALKCSSTGRQSAAPPSASVVVRLMNRRPLSARRAPDCYRFRRRAWTRRRSRAASAASRTTCWSEDAAAAAASGGGGGRRGDRSHANFLRIRHDVDEHRLRLRGPSGVCSAGRAATLWASRTAPRAWTVSRHTGR